MCDLYKEIRLGKRSFFNKPLDNDQMSLAYTILVHGGIEQFERFLISIYHPNNVYCIHVDVKSNSVLQAELNCMQNIFNLKDLLGKHENLKSKRIIKPKYP